MIDIYKNQRVLKRQNAIWTFTIIALVFGALNSLRYFYHFNSIYGIVWNFLPTNFIRFVFYVSTYVLLALYVFKFCRKNWSSIILAAVISLMALSSMDGIANDISNLARNFSANFIVSLFINFTTLSLIISLIISLFTGIKNKIIIFSLCIFSFVVSAYTLISNLMYVDVFGPLFIVDAIVAFIAKVAFYVALLILCTSNKILALKNQNRV